ncbi:hypothetical protein [Pectinatus frisingensis]|uniref:hypothetical protein n=1 Tax=Pectinatus frisingensis TaxID=865 RepID=UPI0018C4F6C0|nr:hypothetical protein [Pectinatus frisingensis]
MDKLHQIEIIKTLTPYLAALPQSKINEGSLIVYARALSTLSIAQIDTAMLKLMRTSKYFPTVAEIFEQVENLQQFVSNTEKPTADAAWQEAMKLAHDKFVYGKWEFSCKEVELAVKRFGKNELCVLEPDGMNTARAQFMRIYDSIVKQQKDKTVNGTILKLLPEQAVKSIIGDLADNMDIDKLPEGDKNMRLVKGA